MDFQFTEEQKQIVASLDEVGREVFAEKAARWDENHEYPWENIHQLRELGVLGMTTLKLMEAISNLIFVRFIEDGKDLGIGGILVDKGTKGFTFGTVEKAI